MIHSALVLCLTREMIILCPWPQLEVVASPPHRACALLAADCHGLQPRLAGLHPCSGRRLLIRHFALASSTVHLAPITAMEPQVVLATLPVTPRLCRGLRRLFLEIGGDFSMSVLADNLAYYYWLH